MSVEDVSERCRCCIDAATGSDLPQSLADRNTLIQCILVEVYDERVCSFIIDLPNRSDHRIGSSLQQGTRESGELPERQGSGADLAGVEKHHAVSWRSVDPANAREVVGRHVLAVTEDQDLL